MLIKIVTLFLLFTQVNCSGTDTWIRAGYWNVGSESPVPEINSALFTHLTCAFAHINPNTFEISLSSADEPYISTFTNIVKRKNPAVITLLSTWTGNQNSSAFSFMVTQSSHRKSFIDSSINIARKYEFQGLELYANAMLRMGINLTNMGTFLDEWRAAIYLEAKVSKQPRLILTMAGYYSPHEGTKSYPIDSLRRNLDWIHIVAYDYHLPSTENFTAAHSALYDPASQMNTDYGIKEWIKRGIPATKLVLGLPYHGYAWTLVNPAHNSIGSPARGLAITEDGSMSYSYIKKYLSSYGAVSVYNSTYVVNYFIINSYWIGYDDVDAIRTKVAYAKDLGLLGYKVWQVPNDYNWMLSKAAAGLEDKHDKRKMWMLIVWPTAAVIAFLLGTMILLRRRVNILKVNRLLHRVRSSSPNLQVFSFAVIKEATNNYSMNNRLGEGGYGPVYKGILQNGQEIAVKRRSLNIEDLTIYYGHGDSSKSIAPLRLPPASNVRDEIEDIVDTTIVSTRNGGYQKYLVKWKDKPWSDCTWISDEEFQHLDLDLYNKYHSFNSSESSFSKPGRNDANSRKYGKIYARRQKKVPENN
ncbi:hypothetical protein AgCh_008699 [Apium graveolens]